MWEVDGEKARKVYRLLFDALTEDRQRQVILMTHNTQNCLASDTQSTD